MNKEMVRELFEYREGNLWWRVRPSTNVDILKPAGSARPKGRRQIQVKGKSYLTHRLIWLYVYGKFPDGQVDHINGDPSDNRIENLRDVTNQENHKNRSKPRSNTSGHIGVHWDKDREKWRARIKLDGVEQHLGFFNVLEDAAAARQAASVKHGFHVNHGRGA